MSKRKLQTKEPPIYCLSYDPDFIKNLGLEFTVPGKKSQKILKKGKVIDLSIQLNVRLEEVPRDLEILGTEWKSVGHVLKIYQVRAFEGDIPKIIEHPAVWYFEKLEDEQTQFAKIEKQKD